MYSKQTSDIMLLKPVSIYSYFIKILCGAWGRQCYHSNDVRNVFGCILHCSICVQKFIEFEIIITELCSFMYLLNLLTQLVTSQLLLNQQFIFCTFLQITSELKEIVYYSKRPISLLFHALSHETINKTIKFYCQCPLSKVPTSTNTLLGCFNLTEIFATITA